MISELTPQHDSRKSFYGKALVDDDGKGAKTLLSYNTPVAKFANGKLTLLDKWSSSATTRRHVAEFAKQMGAFDQYCEMKKGVPQGHGNYAWRR